MTERKAPRHPAKLRTFFSNGEFEGEGTARDLSKQGCRIESETMPAVGTEAEVWIFSTDFEWPLKVEKAVVRWTSRDSFGVEFLTIGSVQRERLRVLIASQKNLGVDSVSSR